MKKPEFEKKGILNPKAVDRKFQLTRHLPSQDLAFFVQRYWIVRWDLPGRETHTQETLPFPCVNLVIEKGQSAVYGVVQQKFSRLLEGKGGVLGIKFRPGAFYPFIKTSVSKLTDSAIGFRNVFGLDSNELEKAVLSQTEEAKMVEPVETFLRERLPERDENVAVINEITDRVIADQEITKVDDLMKELTMSKRTLQRLFRRYVGVSPKWVIQRYRLQEAADRLAGGEPADWPELALDLGYFDQAHFIKDFRAIVGMSPAEYAKSVG